MNNNDNNNRWDVEAEAKKFAQEFVSGKRRDYINEDPTRSTFEVNYDRQYARDDYEYVMRHLVGSGKRQTESNNNNEESEQ